MQKDATLKAAKPGPPTAAKPCAECNLCCTLLTVNALEKPAGVRCAKLKYGNCSIYEDRPHECGAFQCFWSLAEALDETWRPDRAGFVLWSDADRRLIVDVDPKRPKSWRREPYYSQLRLWADRSRSDPMEVLVRVRGRMFVIFPEKAIDLGVFQPTMSVDSGYEVHGGQRSPYARFVPATANRPAP